MCPYDPYTMKMIKEYLGNPETLDQWVETCINEPGLQYWLVYVETDEEVELSTPMFPLTEATNDLTDDEYEAFEDNLIRSGYCYFLNLDQIEDVISNLKMQKSDYSKQELIKALNHYFSRDAFIEI